MRSRNAAGMSGPYQSMYSLIHASRSGLVRRPGPRGSFSIPHGPRALHDTRIPLWASLWALVSRSSAACLCGCRAAVVVAVSLPKITLETAI
jgi:hypothetical protein